MVALPANIPNVEKAKLPVVYEDAKTALSECVEIDECVEWRNKAEALASYARQAGDDEMLRMATRIKSRAIERCGALLREIEARDGRPSKNHVDAGIVSRSGAARDAGLSERQKNTALRVAAVPKEEFERAVESDDPPTITELARMGTKPAPRPLIDLQGREPQDFALSTQVQARLRDFAALAETSDIDAVVRGAFPQERVAMLRNIEIVWSWLRDLQVELENA